MDEFPRSFLLVFFQLAVGGFLCLSIPPFRQVDRGYFKSSGAVYFGFGALALLGRFVLWFGNRDAAPIQALEMALWLSFTAAAAGYLWTLWGERMLLRARLFTATWMSGVLALVTSAESYRNAPVVSVETLLYPASTVLSALLLGAASSGMLLGHWYLIDRDLSLEPLQRLLGFYSSCLALQAALFVAGAGLIFLLGHPTALHGLQDLWAGHRALLLGRLCVSPVGAAVLALMIRRTLQIPQTMAATGLFYIAILAVLVGEMMGRYALFRTGLPL